MCVISCYETVSYQDIADGMSYDLCHSHVKHGYKFMQVLFLDVKQDAQHERLMSFIQAARQHLQTAGVRSSISHTMHVRDRFVISCMHMFHGLMTYCSASLTIQELT